MSFGNESKEYTVLVVNPGSTSTKLCLYDGEQEKLSREIQHSHEKMEKFEHIAQQYDFRYKVIMDNLKEEGHDVEQIDAVVGRGGLIYPVESGTYEVNEIMLEHLKEGVLGEHASNLGGIIADAIADEIEETTDKEVPAYIADPVIVDELEEHVRITGVKEIERKSIFHALSQISSAKKFAASKGTTYQELNLIIAHLGGGISVGAHHKGRCCDVNNALNGEGPFTPQRSGTVPVGDLIKMCFSGDYSYKEMKLKNKGKGGLLALLGTSDFREVEERVRNGDQKAETVVTAMGYRIAREITSLLPAFEGEDVDQVIITGGLARSEMFMEMIKGRLKALNAGVTVYPGENEMVALRDGALGVLRGKEEAKTYTGK